MHYEVIVGMLSVAVAVLGIFNTWLWIRSRSRSEAKETETQRTDLLAKGVTEQYTQWREITTILKAERTEISDKYVKKCEEIAELQAQLQKLRSMSSHE